MYAGVLWIVLPPLQWGIERMVPTSKLSRPVKNEELDIPKKRLGSVKVRFATRY
jgi:hypothetical protein